MKFRVLVNCSDAVSSWFGSVYDRFIFYKPFELVVNNNYTVLARFRQTGKGTLESYVIYEE